MKNFEHNKMIYFVLQKKRKKRIVKIKKTICNCINDEVTKCNKVV